MLTVQTCLGFLLTLVSIQLTPVAAGWVGWRYAFTFKILGVGSASELARIVAAIGLAQNFGATKALATVGIQKGHMALHANNVAVAAGAIAGEVERLARILVEKQQVRQDVAAAELAKLRDGG